MKIFGFVPSIFTKDEFHFYLDSLFSGIITTGILKGEKAPLNEYRGVRVKSEDIEVLVGGIFEEDCELLEREIFITKFLEHPEIGPIFKYFQR